MRNRPRQTTVLLVTEWQGIPTYLAELARNERYRPVGRATSLGAAVDAVRDREPDVVVAEVGTLDRVDLVAAIARAMAPPRIVLVSGLPPELSLLPGLAAGARGFVRKPVEDGLLDHAVSAVAAGRDFVDPRCVGLLVALALLGQKATTDDGLTLRQSQVVHLARGGLSNRQIATVLGLSTETVKTHLRKAMHRLGARSRWDAAERVTAG